MVVGDSDAFPGFLTPVLTQLFFPKPLTTFLACFCRVEKRKYPRKKVRLNQESNSQPPGHEFDMLTAEPPGWGSSFNSTRLRALKCLIQGHSHETPKCEWIQTGSNPLYLKLTLSTLYNWKMLDNAKKMRNGLVSRIISPFAKSFYMICSCNVREELHMLNCSFSSQAP